MKGSNTDKHVISHFPTHVQTNGRHGLFVLPFISECVAKITGGAYVPAMNGIDSYEPARHLDFSEFRNDVLGHVRTDVSWAYKDWMDHEGLLGNMASLRSSWSIYAAVRKIALCPSCGKIEFLADTVVRPKYVNGSACSFCETEIIQTEKEVLLYRPKSKIREDRYSFEPEKFSAEIMELSRRLTEMEYLVSRSRETWIRYLGFPIDPDFYWSTFLSRVIPHGTEGVFLCTKKISWRISLILSLDQDLTPEVERDILTVFVPYLLSENKHPLGSDTSKNRFDTLRSLSWSNETAPWRFATRKEFSRVAKDLPKPSPTIDPDRKTSEAVRDSIRLIMNRKAIDLVGSNRSTQELEAWISHLVFG